MVGDVKQADRPGDLAILAIWSEDNAVLRNFTSINGSTEGTIEWDGIDVASSSLTVAGARSPVPKQRYDEFRS